MLLAQTWVVLLACDGEVDGTRQRRSAARALRLRGIALHQSMPSLLRAIVAASELTVSVAATTSGHRVKERAFAVGSAPRWLEEWKTRSMRPLCR
jgi:hypothetical protein